MAATAISFHRDVENDALIVTGTEGTAAASLNHRLMAEGSRFAVTFTAINAALATFADQAGPLFGRLLPAALADELTKLAKATVARPYQAGRDDVIGRQREDAGRMARVAEPPKDLPYADMDRAALASRDLAGQLEWIDGADRSMLAAVVVPGQARFPGSLELWDRAVERHAALAIIERLGTQADHQLKPTPDQPTLAGPNVASAEAAATAIIDGWRDDQQQVDDAINALRSVIIAIAVATDKPIGETFALLNGDAS